MRALIFGLAAAHAVALVGCSIGDGGGRVGSDSRSIRCDDAGERCEEGLLISCQPGADDRLEAEVTDCVAAGGSCVESSDDQAHCEPAPGTTPTPSPIAQVPTPTPAASPTPPPQVSPTPVAVRCDCEAATRCIDDRYIERCSPVPGEAACFVAPRVFACDTDAGEACWVENGVAECRTRPVQCNCARALSCEGLTTLKRCEPHPVIPDCFVLEARDACNAVPGGRCESDGETASCEVDRRVCDCEQAARCDGDSLVLCEVHPTEPDCLMHAAVDDCTGLPLGYCESEGGARCAQDRTDCDCEAERYCDAGDTLVSCEAHPQLDDCFVEASRRACAEDPGGSCAQDSAGASCVYDRDEACTCAGERDCVDESTRRSCTPHPQLEDCWVPEQTVSCGDAGCFSGVCGETCQSCVPEAPAACCQTEGRHCIGGMVVDCIPRPDDPSCLQAELVEDCQPGLLSRCVAAPEAHCDYDPQDCACRFSPPGTHCTLDGDRLNGCEPHPLDPNCWVELPPMTCQGWCEGGPGIPRSEASCGPCPNRCEGGQCCSTTDARCVDEFRLLACLDDNAFPPNCVRAVLEDCRDRGPDWRCSPANEFQDARCLRFP